MLSAWLGLILTAAGVLAAAGPGLRTPLWVFLGMMFWAASTGFEAFEPQTLALWATAAAGAAAVDHWTGTPAAKRAAVPGPARVSILGGTVLGAAALGPAGVLLGALAGAGVGLVVGGYGRPPGARGRWAVLGPWMGTLAQVAAAVGMAAWLLARVVERGG